MFNSRFGPFDGGSWEALCQQIFKQKYKVEDYQPIPASPGDFGLEGFTLKSGWGFQCYCPNTHYERSELYEKQRDKITADLGKLHFYKDQIPRYIGTTVLNHWVLVTPEFNRHALIAHARTKELEVRSWGLPFISSDFTVLVFDGDDFIVEMNTIRASLGQSLIFDDVAPALPELNGEREDYEENVRRKSEKRLAHKTTLVDFNERVQRMHQRTLEEFLGADGLLRRIESRAPAIFSRLVRLINEFENYVVLTSDTWEGSAEALTTKVRETLEIRIVNELSPGIDSTMASAVARHMVARWLAICELDYD